MNKREIKEAIDRYNERFLKHGYSSKSLGWGEKNRANLRFEILLSQWDFNNASILDFGCGFGDLFGYLKSKNVKNFKYKGVDINANFIEKGKEIFPDADLQCINIFENESNEKYDYILSSGVFNHQLTHNQEFIIQCFDYFNLHSIKGFATNFLSDKVDFKYDYTYHANPSWILELSFNYAKRVVLRNDYMPFEFSIFVNKNDKIIDEFTIYEDYIGFL